MGSHGINDSPPASLTDLSEKKSANVVSLAMGPMDGLMDSLFWRLFCFLFSDKIGGY